MEPKVSFEEIKRPLDTLDSTTQTAEETGGYFDAFMGLANTYVSSKYSESSRERHEPINYARGNTDTIHQPVKGQSQAGETIFPSSPVNLKKVAIYSAIGFGALVTMGVVYKVVK